MPMQSRILIAILVSLYGLMHSAVTFTADSPAIRKPIPMPGELQQPSVSSKIKQVLTAKPAPALLSSGAKRVQELQADHRSAADLAKRSKAMAEVLGKPYVYTVNDKKFDSTSIVPGAPYVFKGHGFGATPGSIKLVGNFPGKAPTFRVDLWQDTVVYTYLEDDITGAYDQDNIQLVVASSTGPIIKSGVKFYAARETRALNLAPQFSEETGLDFARARQLSSHDGFLRLEGNEVQSGPSGSVCGANHPDFREGGADQYLFPSLRPGWVAAGYEWYVGRTDSGPNDHLGRPGERVVRGNYKVTWDPPRSVTVSWATFNSLSAPACPTPKQVWSHTAYEIRVYIEGPRGTAAN